MTFSAPTVADIFHAGIDLYQQHYGPLPLQQRKVVQAIMACRTSMLGGQMFKCDTCELETLHYHSCRNRHCPQCQNAQSVQWVNCRIDELLPVGYYHAVFTIPHELNPFAVRNRAVFYRLHFRAVKETLLELAHDEKRLGGDIGIIAVLHTWGQNLMDHPHIHCIVPGGAIDEKRSKWKSCKNRFLFPVAVVQKLYRGKLMHYFRLAVSDGSIALHGSLQEYEDDTVYKQFLKRMYECKWVVYIKPPFASPEKVIRYLGQYTHRIAISNRRIISHENGMVRFRYRDYADDNKIKTMELSVVEFIRRFLLHVLPKGFRRIRHYGFLANRNRKTVLAACLTFFNKPLPVKVKRSVEQIFKELLNIDIVKCPHCKNGTLKKVASFLPEVTVST